MCLFGFFGSCTSFQQLKFCHNGGGESQQTEQMKILYRLPLLATSSFNLSISLYPVTSLIFVDATPKRCLNSCCRFVNFCRAESRKADQRANARSLAVSACFVVFECFDGESGLEDAEAIGSVEFGAAGSSGVSSWLGLVVYSRQRGCCLKMPCLCKLAVRDVLALLCCLVMLASKHSRQYWLAMQFRIRSRDQP